VVHGNLSQNSQQLQNLSKAFDLKDRASEREKFYISAHYYSEVTREIDKALAIYEQWKLTYPRDSVPWDNLALGYEATGQPEKALANASEALRLNPKDAFAYANLSDAYQVLGRYADGSPWPRRPGLLPGFWAADLGGLLSSSSGLTTPEIMPVATRA
jgi:tetratricopeptide (TPR) repeat protein